MRQYNRVTILKNMAMRKVRDRRRSKDPPGSKVHGMNVRQNSRQKNIYIKIQLTTQIPLPSTFISSLY